MRVKLTIDNKPKHNDVVTGVAWSSADSILSLGDDRNFLLWNLAKSETSKVAEMHPDLFPTGMQWPPRSNTGGAGRKGSELLLVTATDGHFHLLGRGGRIEKSIQAHKGAVLNGHWNWEGTEIVTSGEDGCVRIWSRAGMLRSTMAQCPEPIYACAWSPDSSAILYSLGSMLILKPTQPNSKTTQWKAHDGVILALTWCPTSNLIVTGSEDCKYKVWDQYGRCIFQSGTHTHPITSVAWAPAGDLFSIGSYNVIRVCDRYGWSRCLEKVKTGSIYNMAWSGDSTQFACASASGHVFVASVIERSVSWTTYEAVLQARRTVVIKEFTGNTEDRLDFRDRVIKMSMDYSYLVCVTTTQVYVYNVSNVNTPVVSELRENNAISQILQAPNYFTLCGSLSAVVWTYEGKQVATIKWAGMKAEMMNKDNCTMSNEAMAFIDNSDPKLVHMFDTVTGKQMSQIKMKCDLKQVAFSKDSYPGSTERQLAILDANMDLFVVIIRKYGMSGEPMRLSTMVSSMKWHNEAPMIAVIRDGRLRVYYFPQILIIDSSLLDFTWEDRDLSDIGRQPEIVNYEVNRVSVRKHDGVLLEATASPFMAHLHSHAMMGKFSEARRICRYVNTKLVWGVMAGLAAWKSDLGLAEIAYSELELYDKVLFVQDIKQNINDEPTRKALLAILSGNVSEAENILLQNGRISNAIELNINCCKWERALDLAIKNNSMVDVVMRARNDYLDEAGMKETIKMFMEVGRKTTSASSTKKPKTKGSHRKKKHETENDIKEKTEIETEHNQDNLNQEQLKTTLEELTPTHDVPSTLTEVDNSNNKPLKNSERRRSKQSTDVDLELNNLEKELDFY